MPLDGRSLPRDETLEAEVCIVGAGAAGITLARELAGAPFRVCLLESGGYTFDPEIHALLEGELAGAPYFPLDSCRLRFFGGTTNHWSGVCWPFQPIDFERREGVPHTGWPLDAATLEPWYRRAQAVCQLGPFDYTPERWADEKTAPSLPFDRRRITTAIMQMSPPTRFGHVYRDELERAANVRIVLHANALELETEPSGRRVTAVRAGTLAGNRFRVRARHVVLAAGGIENPRLLLLSDRHRPGGLGNDADLVGRFFMDHLTVTSGLLVPSDPQLPLGLYRQRRVEGTPVRGALALGREAMRREGLLHVSFNLEPFRADAPPEASEGVAAARALARSARRGEVPEELGGRLLAVLGDLDGVAAAAWRKLRDEPREPPGLDRVYLVSHAEQAPNPESRVRLAEERDALGLRRARLEWRLTELDRRSIRRATEIAAEEAGRLGLGRVRVLLDESDEAWADWRARSAWPGPSGAFHHMGTTRMDEDPARGVVDPECRVHGAANLWVAGSSVFPTASFVNPTLTLVALTVRLADTLRRRLG